MVGYIVLFCGNWRVQIGRDSVNFETSLLFIYYPIWVQRRKLVIKLKDFKKISPPVQYNEVKFPDRIMVKNHPLPPLHHSGNNKSPKPRSVSTFNPPFERKSPQDFHGWAIQSHNVLNLRQYLQPTVLYKHFFMARHPKNLTSRPPYPRRSTRLTSNLAPPSWRDPCPFNHRPSPNLFFYLRLLFLPQQHYSKKYIKTNPLSFFPPFL